MRYLSKQEVRKRSKFKDFDVNRELERKLTMRNFGGLVERRFKQNTGKLGNKNFSKKFETMNTTEKVLKRIEDISRGRTIKDRSF